MIGAAPFFSLIFILISTNYLVCSAPYQWDLTNSANNIPIFGQFLYDIFNYNSEFYYTFVKCVSEIAYVRVVNNNPEACANLNLGFNTLKSVGQHIANKINKNFLCPEEPLPRAVVDQLLMLSFTFAMRIIISNNYYNYYWQIQTLLSAYKMLSTSNDDTNGVFPFQISQTAPFGSLQATEFSTQEITKHTSEPNQYTENFKFLLKLSDYSLTTFEVYKLLETILIKAKGMDNKSNVRALGEQPRALYTFVKQYFVENIDNKKSKLWHNFLLMSKKKLLRCALVRFGMILNERINLIYSDFTNYSDGIMKQCNKDHIELFDSYTIRSIAINDQFKGVAPFADALRKMVVDLDSDKNNANGLFKSNEFQILFKILNHLNDYENINKFKYFDERLLEENNSNFDRNSFLNDFLLLLDQIIDEYSCISACQFEWAYHHYEDPIQKNIVHFGHIFFEVFQKYSDEVKYDEKDQLMLFPQMLAERFLQRLYTLTQVKGSSICRIGNETDFVQTMRMIASTDQFEFVRRQNISNYANTQLFKLLFSLAFRLSLQIERSDLTRKYLKAFGFAYNCVNNDRTEKHSFFQFKTNISHKMVDINLPNWKVPDYMQKRIINELRRQATVEDFNFLSFIVDYPLTLYELLKIAKKIGQIELLEKDDKNPGEIELLEKDDKFGEIELLEKDDKFGEIELLEKDDKKLGEIELLKKDVKKLGEMKKNHEMWLNSSESKMFFEMLKYLKQSQEPIQKIKINSENEFCVLAYFVEDLLAELATENRIPNVESIEVAIGQFILTKQEFCTENSIENDDNKYFDENLIKNKAINIDFNPRGELQQIVPEIVDEIKQMLQNDNWNYSHLNYIKIVEWDLLEFDLHKMGNDQKWEQIKQLRNESRKAYSDWYSNKNDENKFNFEETMKNLIQILEGI